jgi:uncharacterized Fe-S cluster-containing radical SAM superfamily protein
MPLLYMDYNASLYQLTKFERKDFRKQLKELKSELPSASIMSKFEAVVKTCIIEDDNKKLAEDHIL